MKKKVVDESIARLEEHVNYVGRFSDEKVELVNQCFGYRLAYLADLNSIIFDSLFSGKFSRDDIAICIAHRLNIKTMHDLPHRNFLRGQ